MKLCIFLILLITIIKSIKSLSEKEKQRKINATKYYLSHFHFFSYYNKISLYYNKYLIIFSKITLLEPKTFNLTYSANDNYDIKINEAKFTICTDMKIEIKNRKRNINENKVFFEITRTGIFVKIINDTIYIHSGNIKIDFDKTKISVNNLNYFKNFNQNGKANRVDIVYGNNIKEKRTNIFTNKGLIDFSSKILSEENIFLKAHINILTYDLKEIIKNLKNPYSSKNNFFKFFSVKSFYTNVKNIILYNNHSFFVTETKGKGNFLLNDIFYNFTFIVFNTSFFVDLNLIKNSTFNFYLDIPWNNSNFDSNCFRNNITKKDKFVDFLKNEYEKYINDTIIQYYNNIFRN